jgi:hypothetical protein
VCGDGSRAHHQGSSRRGAVSRCAPLRRGWMSAVFLRRAAGSGLRSRWRNCWRRLPSLSAEASPPRERQSGHAGAICEKSEIGARHLLVGTVARPSGRLSRRWSNPAVLLFVSYLVPQFPPVARANSIVESPVLMHVHRPRSAKELDRLHRQQARLGSRP